MINDSLISQRRVRLGFCYTGREVPLQLLIRKVIMTLAKWMKERSG
jgi:hypothetical protein